MSTQGLVALAGAGLVLLLGWVVTIGSQAMRRRACIRRRVSPFVDLLVAETTESVSGPTSESRGESESALVTRLNARYPLAGGARTTLIALASGSIAIAALTPALNFVGVPEVLSIVVASLVGGAFGWNIGGSRENTKRNEFSERFLIALEDFHRMVRYGISSGQALNSITNVAAEPVKTSLRNIVLETQFGVPIGIAMDREARRIRISELSMLAAVVATQSRTGGNLSESVENLAAMLRERLDNRSRMRSATAESRITLVILTLVPAAGIGLQAFMQPELVGVLLNEARHLLGIGLGLIVAGLIISWMMIRSAQR